MHAGLKMKFRKISTVLVSAGGVQIVFCLLGKTMAGISVVDSDHFCPVFPLHIHSMNFLQEEFCWNMLKNKYR
jgi:hypothetical protein